MVMILRFMLLVPSVDVVVEENVERRPAKYGAEEEGNRDCQSHVHGDGESEDEEGSTSKPPNKAGGGKSFVFDVIGNSHVKPFCLIKV